MKKEEMANTSQDYDRKHNQDHVTKNHKTEKYNSGKREEVDLFPKEDKRATARHKHTNHFTNRSSDHKS